MLDQDAVNEWLDLLLDRLRTTFGHRLVFAAHHGSWARGEAAADSDIDFVVVVDAIGAGDLAAYRDVLASMPDARRLASSFFGSVAELRRWPRYDLVELFHGVKVLHGSLDGVVDRPAREDVAENVRVKAAANLHVARHYLLHPHDAGVVVHRLRNAFKECTFALRSWMLLQDGTYYARRDDLRAALSDPDDREIVRIARDWDGLEADRESRPLFYIELLERWCRGAIDRLETACFRSAPPLRS